MSKRFEICSATYNIALNQDEDDVFRTGCTHLYHFLHVNGNNGRSTERKPMTLKMHLELNELIEGTERVVEPSNSNNAEGQLTQQPEAKFQSLEDCLQSRDKVETKIIGRMEQLEKNLSNIIVNKLTDVGKNTIVQDTNNALLSSPDNTPRPSDQQLEEKLKTLEDSLKAKDDVVNKLKERIENLEKNLSKNFVNKETDIGNNTIDHESNIVLRNIFDNAVTQSVQQLDKVVKALKDCIEKPEINNDHSDGKEHQTTPRDKQEIQFDRDNLVAIWGNFSYFDSDLETAIDNVIKYAKDMQLSLTPDQIKHIDVRTWHENSLMYYVFFHTKTIKEAFLMKSDILRGCPHYVGTYNESESQNVFIRNFKSSNLTADSNIVNVIGLAKQMGLTLMRDQFYIEVFTVNQSCFVCCVNFYNTQVKDEFLKKSHILKELPETRSLEIY